MSGRSQAVRIPVDYRFKSDEVYLRHNPQTGEVVLSPVPGTWDEVYAFLDEAGFPDDFLADRAQGVSQEREDI